MNSLECFIGVDDGYFQRNWVYTGLAAALHCSSGEQVLPYSIALGRVRVDGADATYSICRLARRLLAQVHTMGGELKAVLLDTPIYAGFNVADPAYISSELGVKVVVVYHYMPDREAIVRALEKNFPGESWRIKILADSWKKLTKVSCPRGDLFISPYGLSLSEAYELTCRLQIFTRTPEPLYTAGVAATAIAKLLAKLGRTQQRRSL
jgi:endonuclease V-like protein UPF0215 family